MLPLLTSLLYEFDNHVGNLELITENSYNLSIVNFQQPQFTTSLYLHYYLSLVSSYACHDLSHSYRRRAQAQGAARYVDS